MKKIHVLGILIFICTALFVSVGVPSYAKEKAGFKKKSGVLYYYKKSGKKLTPIKNKTKKYKGKMYYFSKKGKGFLSLKNKNANKAASQIYDECKLKNSMSKKKKLETLYRKVMERSSYLGVGKPNLSSQWVSATASKMVKKKKGNCYSYAALLGIVAKTLGYNTEIITGKCNRNTQNATEHAWVLIDGKYIVDGVFEDLDYKKGKKTKFYFTTYEKLKNSLGYTYSEESKGK